MTQTQIADILDFLLTESAAALDSELGGANPAPPRQLVTHGMVTVDCPDMLAVYWMRGAPKSQPNTRLTKCAVVTQVTFTVRLQRCSSMPDDKGTPPDAATITAESVQLAKDGQAIWKTLTRLVADGDFPVSNACDAVQFSHLEPKAPSGGSAGVDVVLTVTL